MPAKIISYSFYFLFFLTPLVWASSNYELFEYNKMIFVYAVTTIIVGAWLLRMIESKTLIFKRTPLDIPLVLFLGANILSTIFSIDPHISIWGYYSRSNGGLLSLISYLLLYWAFVSNIDSSKIKNILKFGLASGFLISLWGVLEHFGVSPSCVILRGEFNAGCWIQDVQARVFATLGQPNWLAAYLAMLIFPALYFFLKAKNKLELVTCYLLLVTFYLAFTFTYSRGPTLGLIGGFIVFILLSVFSGRLSEFSLPVISSSVTDKQKTGNWKLLGFILISFVAINFLFGSALTSFRLVSKFAVPARPGITLPVAAPSGTQLENGGTESGQIRFIVWSGALEVFKHYPLFGSGVETFAYSYYQYRPQSHNLTSEWDFLYNKAHNEYLNYLATTGIAGFGTYMLVIGTFICWCIKRIMDKNHNSYFIILASILAAYISYLIYNFFLFSVVIVAIFFYLFPALVFVAAESVKPLKLPLILNPVSSILHSIYLHPSYIKIAKGVVILFTIYLLYSIFQLWYADTLFAKGQATSDAGNPGRAYNSLSAAVELNPNEPFYKSELAFAAAAAAATLKETDATLSARLKTEAVLLTDEVLKTSPKNVSFLRTAVRTYFELATLDKIYIEKTLQTLDTTINFAPTDPKLYYNKALVLETLGKKEEQVQMLTKAIRLKPNYLEALAKLKEATVSAKP
ncbi:O-antigen ligase family protein [Candidatus Daviesbacteria bacterium]|nr:O-antigen ligase family protein [Candidatus Daviesbacteria bacterium]